MRRYFIIPEGLNAIELNIYYYLCNQTNYSDTEYKGKKKFEFNCSLRTIEEDTGINKKTISQVLKKFENDSLIQLIVKGKPPKTPSKYKLKFIETVGMTGVTIDYTMKETMKETIEPVENTSFEEGMETIKETIKETMKGTPSNIIYNKSNIYNDIVGYLNNKLGTSYKATTKATQHLINARLKEGFKLQDFKTVIDIKVGEWINSSEMSKFLRPKTLFGVNFENYLNQQLSLISKEPVRESYISDDDIEI